MPDGDNHNQLGECIRRRREEAGLTLRAAATAAGIDHAYLVRIERGDVAQPSPKTLLGLARVLEVEPQDLFTLAGYTMPEGLPGFAPYLRAKYGLPEPAVEQLNDYFQWLLHKDGDGDDERAA